MGQTIQQRHDKIWDEYYAMKARTPEFEHLLWLVNQAVERGHNVSAYHETVGLIRYCRNTLS